MLVPIIDYHWSRSWSWKGQGYEYNISVGVRLLASNTTSHSVSAAVFMAELFFKIVLCLSQKKRSASMFHCRKCPNQRPVQMIRLVHGNVIPMGIPWETFQGMGQHTFVFPMRLRNRMRVSECHWIVILRLYFWILKSINCVVFIVSLYMQSYLVDTKPKLYKFNNINCIVFHINIIIM